MLLAKYGDSSLNFAKSTEREQELEFELIELKTKNFDLEMELSQIKMKNMKIIELVEEEYKAKMIEMYRLFQEEKKQMATHVTEMKDLLVSALDDVQKLSIRNHQLEMQVAHLTVNNANNMKHNDVPVIQPTVTTVMVADDEEEEDNDDVSLDDLLKDIDKDTLRAVLS